MPQPRIIKFGIIGLGLMGKEFASAAARWLHLEGLDFRPEIVAACDTNEAALTWFKEKAGVKQVTTDYRELLASPEVEAVYCAVPHNLHEQMYIDILRAGKNLMGEKPFGIDAAANRAILEEIEKHPHLLVRCSSEFPYFPGAQRIVQLVRDAAFGQLIQIDCGFLHSSDLDPNKPINWKRRVETCGEYGVMGDLGMHVVHLPARFGWKPLNVRAMLSNVVKTRPDSQGQAVPCETWDNAVLATEAEVPGQADAVPMILETKRIAPGEMNTWYIRVQGTAMCAEFSTKKPKTLRTLTYSSGGPQAWTEEDVGYKPAYPSITGGIFEFGFPDAMLQMWASFCDELVNGKAAFRCATPEETRISHSLFTAALKSQAAGSVEKVGL